MIISVVASKYFDNVQHTFMRKAPENVELKGTYPNTIKPVCDKSTVNIILNA